MAQHTIIENIHRNTEDWLATKAAVRGKGVDCPDDTPTADVAGKIEDIQTYKPVLVGLLRDNISTLVIPASTFQIRNYACYWMSSLHSVEIENGVTQIGNYAFSECRNLQEIIIPSSVSSIGACAFYECYALESISLPNGVFLYDSAFAGCSSLENVELPSSGLSLIPVDCFNGCTSLLKIIIPEGVNLIRNRAFSNCVQMAKAVLPASLLTIEQNAFPLVEDIYYRGTQSQWQAITKGSGAISETATIHYNYSGDGSEL